MISNQLLQDQDSSPPVRWAAAARAPGCGVEGRSGINRPEKERPERTRGRDTGIVIAGSQQASKPESYELRTRDTEGYLVC